MLHEFCIAKRNMGIIKKGKMGVVTRYDPKKRDFAIFWNKKEWVSYTMTEKQFLKNVEKFDFEEER